ncbi:hypothetical protein DXG01_004734 [Tephrocybe rancida]|nr:hypothetical protein DXG01_004734 [Tephrocybe rancida]
MDAMFIDIPEEVMPGAGFDFEDVTDVFKDAAAAMDPGSFVFMDDLTLYDAMGAFEWIDNGDSDSPAVQSNRAPAAPGTILDHG